MEITLFSDHDKLQEWNIFTEDISLWSREVDNMYISLWWKCTHLCNTDQRHALCIWCINMLTYDDVYFTNQEIHSVFKDIETVQYIYTCY